MDAGRLSRIAAVAANTHREAVRERVLYNLVFFAIVMILSGLLLGQLSIRQDEKIIKDIGLAAMDVFGTLIGVFLGVSLMSKEIERRSLYPLLAKPLSREEFLAGKFLGLSFTLFVNVSVMAAGLYATLLATGRGADPALLKAVLPIYQGLVLVVAIAVLFSTVTSSALAAVGTVCVVVAGRYSDVVRNMRDVVPDAPTWLIEGLYYAMPNFRNFDFKNRVVYGDPVGWNDIGFVTVYWLLYLALTLGAAAAAFRSRDFH